ncbi:MAG: L-threonylcarbamoyladenylate synthase [Halieaceae bacterium]|nr:L-threonylcarbamoyladenylate synthase [Halieaceae bacterium]
MPSTVTPLRVNQAITALDCSGVIACPTEAVWGLSCDPVDEMAVERLLQLKHRSPSKGLILVAADVAQLSALFDALPRPQYAKLTLSWPGPTTWLVPHRGLVPHWIHGDHDTVAIRVSSHPVVRALCWAWGGPLVSTSANPAHCQPPVELFQVRRYFANRLDYILPGAVGDSDRPTTIRDLNSDRIIRS